MGDEAVPITELVK